ncbi:hypothetical protein NDU88_002707 [Pleurodeles waltl]|uniref:Uncharacterized protein n=1 Tax=Pleurodeles waltl TaxID=8319 RepID=A0AAV7NNX8_PLEWA|nr:hypothetical protein NDU88_002707 [Pleurodeles waltl]
MAYFSSYPVRPYAKPETRVGWEKMLCNTGLTYLLLEDGIEVWNTHLKFYGTVLRFEHLCIFENCTVIHSKEEERLQGNFRVLTLASGRKEGQDLEKTSSQWQPEAEPGENSAERQEEEQTLRHVRGSTGVEDDSGNLPLHCDPEQETTKRKQPEADQETTQEAVCHGYASSWHASGGAWLRQVCGQVRGLGKTPAAIRPPE